MSDGPYKSCGTSKDDEPYLYGVEGPGYGIGYHGWFLFQKNYFDTREEADKAARLMNMAYAEGQKARSRQIKELLG